MARKLRALRPAGPGVATCDRHLPDALRSITSPPNDDDSQTHVLVHRLAESAAQRCELVHLVATAAAWVLIPQAVLR